ncbi:MULTISPECIES: PEP-CTERM sorting domain-containing protein [Massilia]|jgi:hypothetical protein|uniref:PEP-CTERM sorting domain-containing protein n=1 Tax=Massilia TaxID=149698 RepID=UPI000D961032|nr:MULTISPECIES: PEP-CTERM sorting domain-containing protein [Massilia]QYG01207.1 PEP-CTERM sorting domain-containing protein [Massilia sp. NP310]
MSMHKFVAASAIALGALAFSHSASAVVLTSSSGANLVTDYSEAGVVSFDLDLRDFSTTTLNFVLEEADLAGPLSFSAIVRNLVGLSMYQFNFGLQGIGYASAGSVSSFSGAAASYSGNNAVIKFANGETADVLFGNPTMVDGRSDWLLDTSGLSAGDTFSIVAQVPEPSTVAMVLPLLAGLLLARRRKRD